MRYREIIAHEGVGAANARSEALKSAAERQKQSADRLRIQADIAGLEDTIKQKKVLQAKKVRQTRE